MARVEQVQSARKAQGNCGKCGTEILPGMPYKFIAFRYGPRKVRCGNCAFRPSEMTQGKMGRALAAEEAIEDLINGWDGEDLDSLTSDISDQCEEIREVAQEYEDAASAMEEKSSNSIADEYRDKAQQLEDYAQEIEDAKDGIPEYEGPRLNEDDEIVKEGEEPGPGKEFEPKRDSDEYKAWVEEVKTILAGPLGNMPG